MDMKYQSRSNSNRCKLISIVQTTPLEFIQPCDALTIKNLLSCRTSRTQWCVSCFELRRMFLSGPDDLPTHSPLLPHDDSTSPLFGRSSIHDALKGLFHLLNTECQIAWPPMYSWSCDASVLLYDVSNRSRHSLVSLASGDERRIQI